MADSFSLGPDAVEQVKRVVRQVLFDETPMNIPKGAPPPSGNPFLLGKTTTAHNKGASETVNIYDVSGTKGSESARSGGKTGYATLDSVYNRFADLETDKWVVLVWLGTAYELVAGEC